MTRDLRLVAGDPRPPCPGCAVALSPLGSARRRYWTCGGCGTTMPRH